MPHLRKLKFVKGSIKHWSDSLAYLIEARLPFLEELYLSVTNLKVNPLLLIFLQPYFKNLRVLHVEQNSYPLNPFELMLLESEVTNLLSFGPFPPLEKLTELSLSRCQFLSTDIINNFLLPLVPNIKKLSITYTKEGILRLPHLPNLESLSLCGCSSVDDSIIPTIMSSCPNLISLDLSKTSVTSSGLDILARNEDAQKNLKELGLMCKHSSIPPSVLRVFLTEKFPTLEAVRLCNEGANKRFADSLKGSNVLTKIHLESCPYGHG